MKNRIIGVVSVVAFFVLLFYGQVIAIFPLFGIVYSVHTRIQLSMNHFYKKYIVLGLVFGLFTEVLAVLDNLDTPPEERILFSPDPGMDLVLGVGFYFFIALLWSILVKRYTFTFKSVFIIGGLWGIVMENDMAVLVSPLTQGILIGLLSYVFVFFVYGPFMAIPPLFFKESLNTQERKEQKLRHGILAFLLLFAAWGLAALYMGVVYTALGLSP